MKIFKNISELVGNTPLVEVSNYARENGCTATLLCKLEGKNPAGSAKDRVAKQMIEEAEKYISKREMYNITGIQFMELNTVYQLYALKKYRPHMLERADKILFMADRSIVACGTKEDIFDHPEDDRMAQ